MLFPPADRLPYSVVVSLRPEVALTVDAAMFLIEAPLPVAVTVLAPSGDINTNVLEMSSELGWA